ncbi:MAG: PRD domain-containing protein [Firmicutes bacterium]|nr:PRD domain-containing protein [Bacillota bacterium]
MAVELRLRLLKESGQASHEVIAEVHDIVDQIESHYGVRVDDQESGMFVNHLALALERLRLGRGIDSIPPVVLEEARTFKEEWEFAQKIASRVEGRFKHPIPEAEIGYIALYLRMLHLPGGGPCDCRKEGGPNELENTDSPRADLPE